MNNESCPKCPDGRFGKPCYVKEGWYLICGASPGRTHRGEHLHYRCGSCGFMVATPCSDSKQPYTIRESIWDLK